MSRLHEFINSFHPSSRELHKIMESGSGRSNYRFETDNDSFVLTQNESTEENESFIYLSQVFKNLNGYVPEILLVSKDKTLYVQEDLGDKSLLQLKLENNPKVSQLYEKAVKKLVHLQIGAQQIIDYSKVNGPPSFDKILVLRDLFYFKNYFLDFIDVAYSQSELLAEFDRMAEAIVQTTYRFFMFRDFQGRNIMIKENKPYFIDFQDGMEGPIAYDLVSLLWQAKANLSEVEKNKLFHVYTSELKKLIPTKFKLTDFERDYNICVLVRLLQVVGAYGKLGIIQQKPHFKESLSFGIQNLKEVANSKLMDEYPILKTICLNLKTEQLPKFKM